MNNLFRFSKRKINNQIGYTIHTNSTKQYWKRFFGNKLNLSWFILFIILILSLLVATFFIKNSPSKSIDHTTNLVNNLPSYFNQTITRNFNRGKELEFIRNIANIEYADALKNHRQLVFWIDFDSSKEIGGDQTVYTDIVTLIYNPYNLIKAVNILNKNTNNTINIPNGLYLGTNNQGIDIYSRSITTIWITISLILLAIFINIFIAFNIALVVNIYENNWFINFIDKIINSISVIPEIIWIFLLSIFIGTTWYAMLILLSLICWFSYYKFAKDEIKLILNKEFIIAAKASGLSKWKIAYSHIFRYIFANFMIMLVERFSINILIVSSLAFLDFINDSNNLNIGSVLKEAIGLVSENPSYLIFISIFLILFSLNLKLLSSGLSNSLNPKFN
ncbi:ABC transporter permease subunit [Metamycoplasma canadense]|uniref:Oligopeptide ABC transporter n=1 Tax=Metamycoplasma canadense TaxID=29554 RepID=A0A077L6J7_9BACT|nr:ABC transporter permease subunit [Metamycoplasma canadense]BAP39597.1 oligopeptide ABC transporter [Metamycoplasma canadense]